MQAEGLILAGGQSTRMGGRHKGSLTYRGETFTHRLVKELKKEVSCVRLSYGHEVKDEGGECPIVMDIYPECGPIGGIYAGLKACQREWMLTAACDMPLMKIELYRYMMDMLEADRGETSIYDGAVPVTDGRMHPLAAVYRARQLTGGRVVLPQGTQMDQPVKLRSDAWLGYQPNQHRCRGDMADILEEQIRKGNYRIRDVMKRLNILYLDVTGNKQFEQMLRNVNTMEEYEQLGM